MDIPHVSRQPPEIGSRVKIYFDRKSGDLIIESPEGQRCRDFLGVCIGEAVFDTEPTVRGSTRCIVTGNFLAVPGTRESRDIESEIRAQGRSHLEFYWWRDKTWPLRKARPAASPLRAVALPCSSA